MLPVHNALGWIFDKEEALVGSRLPGSSVFGLFARK